jgi:O-acetyl-ADP-ribose deacetylase (regulator of RNase III)
VEVKIHNTTLRLLEADLTEMAADAIVNAANSALQLGGGVAGAIRRKGGPAIQAECDKLRGTPVGTAVITTGGNLKAKHVIHAVGPMMGEGDEDHKLRNATLNSLKLAEQHHLTSIAFPAISTGIFGFPLARCAKLMLTATVEYLESATSLESVSFCLWGKEAFEVFHTTLSQLLASGKKFSPNG